MTEENRKVCDKDLEPHVCFPVPPIGVPGFPKNAIVFDTDERARKVIAELLRTMGYYSTLVSYPGFYGKRVDYIGKTYDLAVFGCVECQGLELFEDITAHRKFLYSASEGCVNEARRRGWEAHLKPKSLKDILEGK